MKNSGFLPQEREWIGSLLDKGFVDVWRRLYKDIPGYTWWSNRAQAYVKNVGWRIDYQICTPSIGIMVKSARVYKDIKFSDHAPLIVDYDITF
jgi:exodeoxyribonuclease-3